MTPIDCPLQRCNVVSFYSVFLDMSEYLLKILNNVGLLAMVHESYKVNSLPFQGWPSCLCIRYAKNVYSIFTVKI